MSFWFQLYEQTSERFLLVNAGQKSKQGKIGLNFIFLLYRAFLWKWISLEILETTYK